MITKDANNPASHCLGLTQPFQSTYDYGNPHSNRVFSAKISSISHSPPKVIHNCKSALDFLFNQSQQNPTARELCYEIGLFPTQPFETGVLLYLLRMEAIGRLHDWPLLFGQDNSFIIYMIKKMQGEGFPPDIVTEQSVWNQRRAEIAQWIETRRRSCK